MKCLQWVGATPVDTRDELGRERFLVFPIKSHLTAKYPNWYLNFDTDRAVGGHHCCAYHPISFHYVRNNDLLVYEWFFYHSHVYGLKKELVEDFVQLPSLRSENLTLLWEHSGQKNRAYSYGRVEQVGGPRLPMHPPPNEMMMGPLDDNGAHY
ncbi:PREDICTED: glycoprotein-N-acetylgalactosamine 3-beta-galactosyltransferase 1-B-like [Priapulus caudatus]|uniref:Glycoprotein-N-acetylgalactosamine 3-beta-galactosyltransferase 1-B-like n=1 Tax=Priapulus caudatus TaxID=37621 RepID=A0ABM1F9M5_PRICU|nr:PREDICTED: glycoprotein-N-acetylgalactosamine 3-beta-galactosyltransferase 1-B-like [Priapulus caudatus]